MSGYKKLSVAEDSSFIQDEGNLIRLLNINEINKNKTSTINPVSTPIPRPESLFTRPSSRLHTQGYGPSMSSYRPLYTYNGKTFV